MARSLTSLVVALAVLLPGLTWPSAAAGAAMAEHACCRLMRMQGCAGTTISCCPTPERGRETTPPSSSSTAASPSTDQAQHPSSHDVAPQPLLAKALAFDAHAHARANAPPGPLYLKHLTLLV